MNDSSDRTESLTKGGDCRPVGFSAPGEPAVFYNRPAQRLLGHLSNKWAVLVMRRLAKRTMRYAELKRDIGDISEKMLTQTLRQLERLGLVSRKVYPVIPPKVEYSLTDLGTTLVPALSVICDWAVEHIEDVEAAIVAYENRPDGEEED